MSVLCTHRRETDARHIVRSRAALMGWAGLLTAVPLFVFAAFSLGLGAASTGCRSPRTAPPLPTARTGFDLDAGAEPGPGPGLEPGKASRTAEQDSLHPMEAALLTAPPASPDAGTPTAVNATPPLRPPPPTKVHVHLRTSPRSSVSWGKKALGVTPVTIDRPFDSGPLDLVFRAAGYLTVHARAYTFRNDSLDLHLTRKEDAGTLLGAKKAPPPPSPDGGVPPPIAAPMPGPKPGPVPSPAVKIAPSPLAIPLKPE